jgi:hypothetical protein
MIWGAAAENLQLDSGIHAFNFDLSTLPLKPGIYHWMVSLWDGGREEDLWNCVPAMHINTPPMAHPQDEWAGLLNMPYEFSANPVQESESLRSAMVLQEVYGDPDPAGQRS